MMEKVDLMNMKKGSIVTLRCGVSLKIAEARVSDFEHRGCKCNLEFLFEGEVGGNGVLYEDDGRVDGCISHPFDIIRLEPPAFDWKDVKPGMAFIGTGDILIFDTWRSISNSYGTRLVCLYPKDDRLSPVSFAPSNLKRAPEHDIQVQS